MLKKWSKKKILLCPACGKPYEYCHGEVKTPYFRHMDKAECEDKYSESETEEHINGKRDLYEWIKKQDGITNAVLEGWIPETKQRPDIMFNYNNKKYVIEYQCSPIATEYIERHELYKAVGITDIWICGTEKYLQDNMREKTIEDSSDGFYNYKTKTYINNLYYLSKSIECMCMDIDDKPLGIDQNAYKYNQILYYENNLNNCHFNNHIWFKNVPSYKEIIEKRRKRSSYKSISDEFNKADKICKWLSNETFNYRKYNNYISCDIYFENQIHQTIMCDEGKLYFPYNDFVKKNKQKLGYLKTFYDRFYKLCYEIQDKQIIFIKGKIKKEAAKVEGIKYKNLEIENHNVILKDGQFLSQADYYFLNSLYDSITFLLKIHKSLVIGLPYYLPRIESYYGTYNLDSNNELVQYLSTIWELKNIKFY